MVSIFEIRRENMRRLFRQHGGASTVAKRLGYTSASYMAQIAGPNPTRNITDKNARRFEQALGLPAGWFDTAEDGQRAGMSPPPPPLPDGTTAAIVEVIRMVGAVAQAEQVNLSPARFADVAAIAVQDAIEHGGQAREARIRDVVRLLKH